MSRTFQFHLSKSAWVAPVNLAVGSVAIVLHSSNPKAHNAVFGAIDCGNTTVASINRNGSITLANGYKFHANGYGHSCNSAMVLSAVPAF